MAMLPFCPASPTGSVAQRFKWLAPCRLSAEDAEHPRRLFHHVPRFPSQGSAPTILGWRQLSSPTAFTPSNRVEKLTAGRFSFLLVAKPGDHKQDVDGLRRGSTGLKATAASRVPGGADGRGHRPGTPTYSGWGGPVTVGGVVRGQPAGVLHSTCISACAPTFRLFLFTSWDQVLERMNCRRGVPCMRTRMRSSRFGLPRRQRADGLNGGHHQGRGRHHRGRSDARRRRLLGPSQSRWKCGSTGR